MLIRRAALALRIGATLFFALAVALLVKPNSVATFIGFKSAVSTPELLWSLRLVGAVFLLPALLAPLVAAFAGERGLRQAASGMAFISVIMGTVSLFAPVGWAMGTVLLAGIWYLFALFYFYALRGRGRNR